MVFRESPSLPGGGVTALLTDALTQRSNSHTPLFLLVRILIYSFGVGQGLTVGASYRLGLRGWGFVIYMWEGLGCCSYMTDDHKPLEGGAVGHCGFVTGAWFWEQAKLLLSLQGL